MSLDRIILISGLRIFRYRDPSRIVATMRNAASDPEAQYALFGALGAFWLALYPIFGLTWVAVCALLRSLHLVGNATVASGFLFGAAFCIAGAVDALWRHILTWAARGRYRRAGGVLDDRTRRLLHFARLNDATLLIQIFAGLVVAFGLWRKI